MNKRKLNIIRDVFKVGLAVIVLLHTINGDSQEDSRENQ